MEFIVCAYVIMGVELKRVGVEWEELESSCVCVRVECV